MRPPRWVATLPLSLALHVGLVVAALVFLNMESAPRALIVDLDAIIAGDAEGPGGAPPPAAPPAAKRSSAPSLHVAAAPTPQPPEPPQDPVPAASPPVMPQPPAGSSPPTPALATIPSTPGTDVVLARATGPGSADGPVQASGSGSTTAPGSSAEGKARGGGAGGDVVAALPPGAGSGGGAGTGVGSEYGPYLSGIRQRIQESLRYPAAAQRRGVTGTVQIEIAIAVDGSVARVSVVTSSSHAILDRAAVESARSLPRVPFPADVRPQPLTIRLPVVFEMK